MMKQTALRLLSVFSVLLLLVLVTASPRARSNPNPVTPVPGEITGQIRWKKEMGLIPMGPGHKEAAILPCLAFYVAALDPRSNKLVALSDGPLPDLKEQGEYYICTYTLRVPLDTNVYLIAGMGGTLKLPEMDTFSYYWKDPWIGGTRSQPPAGTQRGFTGYTYAKRPAGSKTLFVRFDMIYVRNDDPK